MLAPAISRLAAIGGLVAGRWRSYIPDMRLNPFKKKTPLVAAIRLEGVIAPGGRRHAGSLNDHGLASLIEKAFRKGKPSAVALVVNSPGGSPVQSSLIGGRIRRLSEERGIPVYAFVEDLAVSGGYWIAASADEIFADINSIVGSIGVISSSFGFQEFLQKAGIERRVHTAGEDKGLLDPFLPEDPKDVERLKQLQENVHQNFIAHVKARRGGRLKGEDLFTGKFWSGEPAAENGLIDGIGSLVPKMQEVFGKEVRFRNYSAQRKFPFNMGSAVAGSAADAFEERLLRARFGL